MRPNRGIAQMLAAAALITALAIGSAVYTVAAGGSDIAVLASTTHVMSSIDARTGGTA
jgi:hypothetical protein